MAGKGAPRVNLPPGSGDRGGAGDMAEVGGGRKGGLGGTGTPGAGLPQPLIGWKARPDERALRDHRWRPALSPYPAGRARISGWRFATHSARWVPRAGAPPRPALLQATPARSGRAGAPRPHGVGGRVAGCCYAVRMGPALPAANMVGLPVRRVEARGGTGGSDPERTVVQVLQLPCGCHRSSP